ncbi:bifunctional diguanylate cyclase/phosphodiesterase [Hyphomicrobium sp. LHD-15]|uniref:bifunctional diguanylate cyclase/phosphodiesterase n=1 Tax=Hyphomicrobium sp. LHD-15 TaxID=3072142 RepID=UPI00280D2438|nr:bifunctional diguanylate cyclase/phosphodiesterase [Hyphomicrobium sp. LHD-15]MDQ8698792.1 bifunctional diguanylate cyclase/phosphodiesterase [Hyphomicrobium sp. LHD-15]
MNGASNSDIPPGASSHLLEAANDLEDQRLLKSYSGDDAAGIQRARVFEAVGALLGRAEPTRRPFALLMIAANAIDAINVEIGFDAGDELIAAVGHLLKSKLEQGASIWRYGSNTFAVLIDDCAEADIESIAERLIAAVGDTTFQISAAPFRATVSIGGVAIPARATAVGEAVSHALAALDDAKRLPGSFVAHHAEHDAKKSAGHERSVSSDILSALEENRFRIVLQPIVEASSGKPALYEVLLRMEKRDGTLVAAVEFIEDAEKLGLARLLDRRALDLALAVLGNHPSLKLSLNISSQTAGDKSWLAALQRAAADTANLASRLTVEITETAMIHDIDRIAIFVGQLHALGCKVAIDDFGAGYTSFRHLKTLKVDMLKIDGMFMSGLPRDHQNRALVKSIIDIADAFGLETVAEWVRDEETANILRAAGIKYLQGYLHGMPISVSELT